MGASIGNDNNTNVLKFLVTGLAKPLVALFVFILSGCQYDPHAHLLTTTEPSNDDIVGTYVLDTYFLPHNIKLEDSGIRVKIMRTEPFQPQIFLPGNQIALTRISFLP